MFARFKVPKSKSSIEIQPIKYWKIVPQTTQQKTEETQGYKFILIGENVLNFHSSDDSYYEEWYEDVSDKGGWIICLNMPEQTQYDFRRARLHHYIELIDFPQWRTLKPDLVFSQLDNILMKRLNF